jgi:hypothetical protein
MKTARFSPKPTLILDATTVLRLLKKARDLQISKQESHSDTEYRLFYLNTGFATNLLFYIPLYVGHLSPCICHRCPVA